MLVNTRQLLEAAARGGYAVGGFNVYNLEGVRAVINAAEAVNSPVILQVHPAAFDYGGMPLLMLCQQAARDSSVPTAVHLDHSTSLTLIESALSLGIRSVMADGSHLPYADNLAFVARAAALAQASDGCVEAELGRISGTEDAHSVADYDALMTDPTQAAAFVEATHIDALAVCIGNVHGVYRFPPQLDFERLAAIRAQVSVPLVLHGASGLPAEQVHRAIELGVRKFNVNTEVRTAFVSTLRHSLTSGVEIDLLPLMQRAVEAMQAVVAEKLALFGSVNRVTPLQADVPETDQRG